VVELFTLGAIVLFILLHRFPRESEAFVLVWYVFGLLVVVGIGMGVLSLAGGYYGAIPIMLVFFYWAFAPFLVFRIF
jgi:hypothetical protein